MGDDLEAPESDQNTAHVYSDERDGVMGYAVDILVGFFEQLRPRSFRPLKTKANEPLLCQTDPDFEGRGEIGVLGTLTR